MRKSWLLVVLVAVALSGCSSLSDLASDSYRASWYVIHDHGDGWEHPGEGTLYVTRSGMIGYRERSGHDERGGNRHHSFEVRADQVSEVERNLLVGADRDAFHVRLQWGDNYNFAIVGRDGEYRSSDSAVHELNDALRDAEYR